jgi:hypothetical protein
VSIFNEVELPKNADIIAEADTEIHIAARTRKASRRKPLPEVLNLNNLKLFQLKFM